MSTSSLFAQLNQAINANPLNKDYNFGVEGQPASAMDTVNPMLRGVAQAGVSAFGGDMAPVQTSQEKVAARKADHREVLAKQAASLGLHDLAKSIVTGDVDNKEALDAMQKHKDAKAEKAAVELENKRTKEAARLLAVAKVKATEQEHKNAKEMEGIEHAHQMAQDAAERAAEAEHDEQEAAKTNAGVYTKQSKKMGIGDGSQLDIDFPVKPLAGGLEKGKSFNMVPVNETQAASEKAGQEALELIRLAEAFDKVDPSTYKQGWRGEVQTQFAKITGDMDKDQLTKLQGRALLVKRAIGSLPAGPASDKDIALVMNTVLGANTSPKDVARYFRGMAKLALIQKEQAAHLAEVTRIQGHKGGAEARWEEYRKMRFPGIFGTEEQREAANVAKDWAETTGSKLSPRDAIEAVGLGVDPEGNGVIQFNRADFMLNKGGE